MGRERADAEAVGFPSNPGQARDRLKVDQIAIVQRALIHEDDQRGAAAQRAALLTVLLQKLYGFFQGSRLQQIKGTNRHRVALSRRCFYPSLKPESSTDDPRNLAIPLEKQTWRIAVDSRWQL